MFRKESTALTPSALRKKVAGLRPLALSSDRPPLPITEFRRVLTLELSPELAPEAPAALAVEEPSDVGVVVVVITCPPGVVMVVVMGEPGEVVVALLLPFWLEF